MVWPCRPAWHRVSHRPAGRAGVVCSANEKSCAILVPHNLPDGRPRSTLRVPCVVAEADVKGKVRWRLCGLTGRCSPPHGRGSQSQLHCLTRSPSFLTSLRRPFELPLLLIKFILLLVFLYNLWVMLYTLCKQCNLSPWCRATSCWHGVKLNQRRPVRWAIFTRGQLSTSRELSDGVNEWSKQTVFDSVNKQTE